MSKVQVDHVEYEIEAILFDKDGTLIELDVLWSLWFDELWRKINDVNRLTKKSKQDIAQSIGLDIHRRLISVTSPLAIGTMEDIAIILSFHLYTDGLPWNDAVRLVRESMDDVHETMDWHDSLQPVRELEPFLQEAKKTGIKLAVVTSDDTQIAKLHLRLLNLEHYFDSIIGSDNISRPKPFPDIGLQACEELDVSPKNVIVIGDTNADMNLGRNLKAKATIGIVHEDKGDGAHLTDADYIINHYGNISIA